MIKLKPLCRVLAITLCALTVAEPAIAKCKRLKLTTPISLIGDGQGDMAIKAFQPVGSSVGWKLMFIRDDTLVPITFSKHTSIQTMGGNAFFNEVHGDCLHADARYFRLLKAGEKSGFYVIQSTIELSDKAESYDDFTGAKVLHELFRYDERDVTYFIGFQKVTELELSEPSCSSNHLIEDFKSAFPTQLSDGNIEPAPTCSE